MSYNNFLRNWLSILESNSFQISGIFFFIILILKKYYFSDKETLLIRLPTTDLTVINASDVSTTSPDDGILPN